MMEQNEGKPRKTGYSVVHIGSRIPSAVFDHGMIDDLTGILPNQTKEGVMDALGISANTWVKIKRGEPIRLSTAERLVERLKRKAV